MQYYFRYKTSDGLIILTPKLFMFTHFKCHNSFFWYKHLLEVILFDLHENDSTNNLF